MPSLSAVTGRWLPSTPGPGLDQDIRAMLLAYGLQAQDLDAWQRHSHGDHPYLALAQNLQSCTALDHANPTPDGVVPLWPVTMDIDDAMAWLITFCQGGRQRGSAVRAWHERTPHGWAFAAAGVSIAEAVADGVAWDWDRLRTMAALRGVQMPQRCAGFEVKPATAPAGQRPVAAC